MPLCLAATRAALLLALSLGLLLPAPARAVDVEVDGIIYDVVFFQGPQSFAANSEILTDMQTAPWWGNEAVAFDFANAYRSQVSVPYPFNVTEDMAFVSSSIDILFFGYNNPTPTIVDAVLLRQGGGSLPVSDDLPTTENINRVHYAYVATPIPEIDGGALGQGAVILLALWLMLRRRGAMRA